MTRLAYGLIVNPECANAVDPIGGTPKGFDLDFILPKAGIAMG